MLTVAPCADRADGHIGEMEVNQSPVSNHTDIDQCSPFCACVCCQTNIQTSAFIKLNNYTIPVDIVKQHIMNIVSIVLPIYPKPPQA
jgi:hypothetical protein